MPRGYAPDTLPLIVWRYWGIVTFMMDNPGLYGMDAQRTECHKELAAHIGLTPETTRSVTDHMSHFLDDNDPVGFYNALLAIKA